VTTGPMSALEAVLTHVSLFEALRADEVGRIAHRFELVRCAPGSRHAFAAQPRDGRLVVVVEGAVHIDVESGAGALRGTMYGGDRYGALSLVTEHARPFALEASEDGATIATMDSAAFEAVLAEYPAVALPLAAELSTELAASTDVVRQVLELHAERLPPEQLKAAVDERRTAFLRRGARVSRLGTAALFRRLVVQEGSEPPFWMLIGFLASLGGARLVVHLILKYKLEKQLFALVPGSDPNPMHVHHFNYGLVLIGAAGLASLFPLGRRALRLLALAFGLGCGLVFDEFALFWRLDPEYAQGLSLFACGAAAALLVQLTYFRRFWAALARRAWLRARGLR
jgi:CRP-like cAMP-binding protein